MKNLKPLLLVICILSYNIIYSQESKKSQTDVEMITETLMHYIDGTANGQPDRLKKAFHPDFNLYTIQNDSVRIRDGQKYISLFKPGKKANRVGRIISIDFVKDAASAKAEIIMPGWRVYTDYFLLMKYQGSWKIIQKSYTFRPIPKSKE